MAPERMGDLGRVKRAGRGSAAGDLDGDGRLDLVLNPISNPAAVYRNEIGGAGHWIEILPVGDADGPTPLHAKVSVTFGGRVALQEFTVTPSYASGSWTPLHFGLGSADRIESLRVVWPEGTVRELAAPPVDKAYRVSRRDGLMPGLAGRK
jgi:hypothetical protein